MNMVTLFVTVFVISRQAGRGAGEQERVAIFVRKKGDQKKGGREKRESRASATPPPPCSLLCSERHPPPTHTPPIQFDHSGPQHSSTHPVLNLHTHTHTLTIAGLSILSPILKPLRNS